MKQFILILLLLTALESQGQYVWKQNADIPTKGCFQSAFVIGDVAYAGLGCISFNGYKTTDKFYKYDPVGDTWTPVASFPGGGRYGAAAFALKGKGYICFGRDDAQNWNNEIWEYDPAADTWTRKKDFPGGARYESTGFAINDTGYIAGGSFNAGTNYLKDAWRYFPVSDVWSQLPDLPVEHKSAAAGLSLNGKGYVLGGLNDTYTASNDNLVYDPELNHWTQLPSFPGAPLRDPAAFTLEGKIFLGAGMNPDPSGSEVFSSFRAFDPALSTWSSCPGLPSPASPRYGATGFTVADAGYIIGGLTRYPPDSGVILNETWSFKSNVGFEQHRDPPYSLFPNPVSDYVTLNMDGDAGSGFLFRVVDLYGREVYAHALGQANGPFRFDLSGLAQGIYVTEVIHEGAIVFRDKLVVRP